MAIQFIQSGGANKLLDNVARDKQNRATLNTTNYNLESKKRAEATAAQQSADATALDQAKFKDAKMQGTSPMAAITPIPRQQDDGSGVEVYAPAQQPSMTDQRINALEGVTGGGAMAQSIRADQVATGKNHEQDIYELMKAGGKGRPDLIEQAKFLNKQHGVGMPDYFFDDPIILQTLVQAIGLAQKSYKDPQQQNSFIQSYLQSNPEFAKRVAFNEASGRGIQQGFAAGAKTAESMATDKNKQALNLQTQKNVTAKSRNQWPDRRVRLELIKQYRQIKDRMGRPVYDTAAKLKTVVDQAMSELDQTPSVATEIPKPKISPKEWLDNRRPQR